MYIILGYRRNLGRLRVKLKRQFTIPFSWKGPGGFHNQKKCILQKGTRDFYKSVHDWYMIRCTVSAAIKELQLCVYKTTQIHLLRMMNLLCVYWPMIFNKVQIIMELCWQLYCNLCFQTIGGVAESVSLHISKPQIVVIEVMVVQNTKVEPWLPWKVGSTSLDAQHQILESRVHHALKSII